MSRIPNEQLHPKDEHVSRNRIGRLTVLMTHIVITTLVCVGIGTKITHDWFGFGLAGMFIGLVAAVLILCFTLDKFFVSVELASAFVTINLAHTLFGRKKRQLPDADQFAQETEEERHQDRRAFPVYGPGLHISYPWEERNEDYTFSLKEVSSDISFPILLKDGKVTLKGSYRLRPDMQNLIPFLSGVASSAEELQEIISAFAVETISPMTVDDALGYVKELNDALNKKFGLKTNGSEEAHADDNVSDFERRFGVYVGDITIAEILPSEEIQKTRGSITEARAIAEGTAILLGYKTPGALAKARSAKKITDEQISRARDRFLSISGNMEGMELKRNEFDFNITGLDPEAVKAIAPLAAMYAAATANKTDTKK